MKHSKTMPSQNNIVWRTIIKQIKTNVDEHGLRKVAFTLVGNINQIHTTEVENRTDIPQKFKIQSHTLCSGSYQAQALRASQHVFLQRIFPQYFILLSLQAQCMLSICSRMYGHPLVDEQPTCSGLPKVLVWFPKDTTKLLL